MIRRLRALEMPVAEVKAVVSSDDVRELEHRSVPEQATIGIRAVIDTDDALAWWRGALRELHAAVAAKNLRSTGPSGGLFASELHQHDRGEAIVFIPVDGAVRAIGRAEPVLIPPAELAVVLHRGSLADVDVTYGALGVHASTHEISIDGPLRETYLVGAHDTDDEDAWRTEVGWPIFRSDAASPGP